ncbi:hypothetical protein QBC43DRAFT_311757 [Cladorrhinum sp. PSN259]|nr:hypothetical protein QBC43DRAFT_311757 [Cladorrhinum sp. PSN259]
MPGIWELFLTCVVITATVPPFALCSPSSFRGGTAQCGVWEDPGEALTDGKWSCIASTYSPDHGANEPFVVCTL